MTYNAFISYSHAADGRLAPALQSALQQFAKPWYKLRALRVFRDQTNLSANPGLWTTIEQALGDSQYFILLASPQAARSKWVHREVAYWLTNRSANQLFIVLTDGDVVWNDSGGDFDWAKTTALPENLAKAYHEEPLYLDLRSAKTTVDLSLRNPDFLNKVAELAAPIHGESLDGIVGEDVRQHRKTRRLVRIVVSTLLVLTVSAILAATIALEQSHRADAQRKIAEEQRREADEQRQAAEQRLAEGLVSSGDSLALADRWEEAKVDYEEARGVYERLGMSPLRADLGIWDVYRHAPPSLLTLNGHSGPLTGAVFSPDGRTILSSSLDETLKLWDAVSGRMTRSFGARDLVTSAAISPDGRLALSGGANHTLKLWELPSGREVRTLQGHDDQVTGVAFSPDGRRAVSGGFDHMLKVWDVASGQELEAFETLQGDLPVEDVAFAGNDHTVLDISPNGVVEVWDLKTGPVIQFGGSRVVQNCVAVSPDGRTVVSNTDDKALTLWERATGKEIRTLGGHGAAVSSLAFSHDGRFVLSGSHDTTVKLWDVGSGSPIRTFVGHRSTINRVAFSPDDRFAVSAGDDMALKVWDLGEPHETRALTADRHRVRSVAFSPDGLTAILAADPVLKLFDLATGRELRQIVRNGAGVSSVAFCPDGRNVLSADFGNTVMLHDVSTGQKLKEFDGHTDVVRSIACSPRGRFALSGSDDTTAKLWNLETGQEVRTFSGHGSQVFSVVFSPDGRQALSGSADTTLKLWDVATGQEVRTFRGHSDAVTSVAFSRDGQLALSGSKDKTVKLWKVASGDALQTFSGHQDWIWGVAFLPDDRVALSVSADGLVRLWDAGTGREIRSLSGHKDAVLGVDVSADGRVLSGSLDGTAILWDLSRGSRYHEFETKVDRAVSTLQGKPEDAVSLADLGEWYAFRGIWTQAVELLEKARMLGAVVPSLTLARGYWGLKNPDGARREFQRAREQAEASEWYIDLCMQAVDKDEQLLGNRR